MLSDCKLPFQCAHGRPTMVPLVKLNSTKTTSAKEEKPRLWKLKNDDPVPIFNKLDILILQLSVNSKCKRKHGFSTKYLLLPVSKTISQRVARFKVTTTR